MCSIPKEIALGAGLRIHDANVAILSMKRADNTVTKSIAATCIPGYLRVEIEVGATNSIA